MELYIGKEVWSPEWGRGFIVRLHEDGPWDVEVLYRNRTGSLLYYGLAWGHTKVNDVPGGRFLPPLLEWP